MGADWSPATNLDPRSGVFNRGQSPMSKGRLPEFIIIGAARSGTTTISRYLRAHPHVFMAQEKEVHFFDTDETFALGVDWYTSRFAAAGPDQIPGEATPAYMAKPEAVDRMASVVPNARLIAILRNPTDRAYSMYWLARAWGAETREPEEALGDAMRNPASAERASDYLGSYVEQLEHVRRLYPASALMTLLFEDFSAQPEAAVGCVCEHIGVDPHLLPKHVGSFRNEPRRVLSPTIHALGERVRTRNVRIGERILLLNSRKVNPPAMDRRLRSELVEYFRPHNDALSQWLGRDLSHWNR